MKYGKVATLLKKSKRIEVFCVDGCQWIGEGNAAYPMYGMPMLDRDNIFDLFGVAVDKRDDYLFHEHECPEAYNFSDVDDAEEPLERGRVRIVYDGVEYMPLESSAGAILIRPQYLAPFGDTEFDLYERKKDSGARYVAVKRGMALLGIIMPNIIKADLDEALWDLYWNVHNSEEHARNDDGQISLD